MAENLQIHLNGEANRVMELIQKMAVTNAPIILSPQLEGLINQVSEKAVLIDTKVPDADISPTEQQNERK